MKQLKRVGLLVCIMHNMQCMEVAGETKRAEKKILFTGDKQLNYSSLSNSYDRESNAYHKEDKSIFLNSSTKLPIELKEHIAINCVKLYLIRQKMSNFESHPFLMLNLLCRVQEMSPLRIGNKEFGWRDLIVLKKEEQENFFNMGNPSRCWTCLTGLDNVTFMGSNNVVYAVAACFAKLRGENVSFREYSCHPLSFFDPPIHIKKDLIIQENECYGSVTCGCCTALGLIALMSSITGIIGSSSGMVKIAGGLITLPSTWYLAARSGLCNNCCVRKYSVDQRKYL